MKKMKEYWLTLFFAIALVLSLSTSAVAIPEPCCDPAGGCIFMEPMDCAMIGGTTVPDCAMCGGLPPEACCDLATSVCVMEDPLTCMMTGRVPGGPGTTCAMASCGSSPPTQACCDLATGGCTDVIPTTCTSTGGISVGSGSDCITMPGICSTGPPVPEACCFPGGTCTTLLDIDCVASGGTPGGSGSDCTMPSICSGTPPEACCDPMTGTCSDEDPFVCASTGRVPMGFGTDCSMPGICGGPAPEACCFDDVTPCMMMFDFDCLASGGTPGGSGSDCIIAPCLPSSDGKEFGDAPEGAVAYPSTGVIGSFPTCMSVFLGGWIEHETFGAWFGPLFEFEVDGNAGFCPTFTPSMYDMDECFMDGDAGLLFPDPFTITGPLGSETVVPCPASVGSSLGSTCTFAVWGMDIDIDVTNLMPPGAVGYVNVLIDWNKDGVWSGSSICADGTAAPEWVLVDHKVTNGYVGPLSMTALPPPPFKIGPVPGFVWVRISITNVEIFPITAGWDGSGSFKDGETEDYLLHIEGDTMPQEWDWGDAPDSLLVPGYPTLAAHMGASHFLPAAGNPYFDDGTGLDAPDPELDGQPNATATGDDILDGSDDEDGVMIPSPLVKGMIEAITYTLPLGGCVDAWIDFDGSGSWEAAEKIITMCYPPGTYTEMIPIPLAAVTGTTFARFRVSTPPTPPGGLPPTGPAPDGEVEDHEVLIKDEVIPDELDWGDAPDSFFGMIYPTLSINGGASHIIVPGGPYFDDGTLSDFPDSEPDGQPEPSAMGDDLFDGNDDEDGIVIPPLVKGTTVTILLDLPAGGCVDAWIDFDASTSWDAVELLPGLCYPPGVWPMAIPVPTSAVAGPTFARFRVSTLGVLLPTGPAPDGEVEDHEVFIEEDERNTKLKFQQLPLNGPLWFGHDELSVAYLVYEPGQVPAFPIGYQGCYMADDFADHESTPVRRIKWWGSYIHNDIPQPVDKFEIAFETDIPASPLGTPSHPGDLLSSQVVHLVPAGAVPGPGEYTETRISFGGAPCLEDLYEYEAVLKHPFPEQRDIVYWLKIVALVDLTDIESADIQVVIDTDPLINSYCEYIRQVDLLGPPLTRWGWHNRDWSIPDLLASTPPAVSPGESVVGVVPDPAGVLLEVWHFQDDAVEGDVFIDIRMPMDPDDPESWFVIQPTWRETYYNFVSPFCATPMPPIGADGPIEISQFSKDLAFELYTEKYPPCWDCLTFCFGDADCSGGVGLPDFNILKAAWSTTLGVHPNYNPCADFDRSGSVGLPDFNILKANWSSSPPALCTPGDINGIYP